MLAQVENSLASILCFLLAVQKTGKKDWSFKASASGIMKLNFNSTTSNVYLPLYLLRL